MQGPESGHQSGHPLFNPFTSRSATGTTSATTDPSRSATPPAMTRQSPFGAAGAEVAAAAAAAAAAASSPLTQQHPLFSPPASSASWSVDDAFTRRLFAPSHIWSAPDVSSNGGNTEQARTTPSDRNSPFASALFSGDEAFGLDALSHAPSETDFDHVQSIVESLELDHSAEEPAYDVNARPFVPNGQSTKSTSKGRPLPKYKVISAAAATPLRPSEVNTRIPLYIPALVESASVPVPTVADLIDVVVDTTVSEAYVSASLIDRLGLRDSVEPFTSTEGIRDAACIEARISLTLLLPNCWCFKPKSARAATHARPQMGRVGVECFVVPQHVLTRRYAPSPREFALVVGQRLLVEARIDMLLSRGVLVVGACNRMEVPVSTRQEPTAAVASAPVTPAEQPVATNPEGIAEAPARAGSGGGARSKAARTDRLRGAGFASDEEERFPRNQREGSRLWEPDAPRQHRGGDDLANERRAGKDRALTNTALPRPQRGESVKSNDGTSSHRSGGVPGGGGRGDEEDTVAMADQQLAQEEESVVVSPWEKRVPVAPRGVRPSMAERVKTGSARESGSGTQMHVFRTRRAAGGESKRSSTLSGETSSASPVGPWVTGRKSAAGVTKAPATTTAATKDKTKPTSPSGAGAFQGGAFKWI